MYLKSLNVVVVLQPIFTDRNLTKANLFLLLLLCSHSHNDVPPVPQRNVSIAAERGAVRPSKANLFLLICFYSTDKKGEKLYRMLF